VFVRWRGIKSRHDRRKTVIKSIFYIKEEKMGLRSAFILYKNHTPRKSIQCADDVVFEPAESSSRINGLSMRNLKHQANNNSKAAFYV
jgi:hypothetical protein